MTQMIELPDKDLEKVDRLIKNGMFLNREHVIKTILESLLELSEEEWEKIKEVQKEVNSYCEIHLGNILYAGVPVRVVINGDEYFKVPVKGVYEGNIYTYGNLYVAAKTLAVDEQLSDSREKIHKTAEELTGYDDTII